MQEFGEKSDDLTGVFNSCWVFRRAKCGIYKPIWVDYKPYWGMWKDGTTFGASMSAGRILKSPIVKRVREEKDFGTMNRKDFCGLMSFRVEFGRIVARFGRYH